MSVETAETLPPPEPPPLRDTPATSGQETAAETPLTGDADQLLDQEKPLEAESQPAVQEAQEPNDAEQIEDLEATNTATGDTTTGGNDNDQLLAGEHDLETEPRSDDPAAAADQETDENGSSQTSSASTVSPESAQDEAVGSANDPADDNDEETGTGETTVPLGGSDTEIDKSTGGTSDTDVTDEEPQSGSTDEDLTPNAANNDDLTADREDADEAETRQTLTDIQSQDESPVDEDAPGAATENDSVTGQENVSDTLNGNDDIADMGTRRDQRAVNDLESRVPAPPKEPGDVTLPNDSPVYYREHSTAIGYDSSTASNASVIKPEDGFHDVVVHGNDKGYFVPGAVNAAGNDFSTGEVHPNHIADAIVGNPAYSGGSIRLISCYTGTVAESSSEIPAAQAVADQLGVPVKAPTDKVGASRWLGTGQEPVISNDGHWKTFLPRGETP